MIKTFYKKNKCRDIHSLRPFFFFFFRSQSKMPSSGKGSVSDIVKHVSLKTQTQVELATNRLTGSTTFLISGKADDVKRARREIVMGVGIQVIYAVCTDSIGIIFNFFLFRLLKLLTCLAQLVPTFLAPVAKI